MIKIRKSKKYGRGVYATRDIKTGELVESSPVLVLDEWEATKIYPTVLNHYVFSWNEKEESAIAFGFGSLFNHSRKHSLTYQPNYKNKTIDFVALRDIKKGEQLFINYGYSVENGIESTKNNRKVAEAAEKLQNSRIYGT